MVSSEGKSTEILCISDSFGMAQASEQVRMQMEGGRGRKVSQVEISAFVKTHRQERTVPEKWECR